MARLACTFALLLLAACPQEISGLDDPTVPPDAETPLQVDASAEPEPDAGRPPPPDAGQPPAPDAGRPAGPDAATLDLGACTAAPSPARVGQAVTVSCAVPAGMTGPTGWSVEGLTEVDGGFTATAGGDAGTGVFTLWSVPRNFPDTTLKVHARFHGAAGDGVATATVPVLGNLWVAKGSTAPAITAFTTSPEYAKWGGSATDVVGQTEFDAAPRALAPMSNGDILVAQANKPSVAPPVFVLSRTTLQRIDSIVFDARAPGGEVLFDQAKYVSPRAVLQTTDGNVWVTGNPRPVVFGSDGKFKFKPTGGATPSSNTVGLAQLADGRVAVSYSNLKLGLYSLDGNTYEERTPLDGGAGYSEIEALCALEEGGLVLALNRYLSGASGGLLVELSSTLAYVRETPKEDWLDGQIPSHLIRVGDEFVATPALDMGTAYLFRYDRDLKRLANVGSGYGSQYYSGVVRLR